VLERAICAVSVRYSGPKFESMTALCAFLFFVVHRKAGTIKRCHTLCELLFYNCLYLYRLVKSLHYYSNLCVSTSLSCSAHASS
jgi:hypothetical protein